MPHDPFATPAIQSRIIAAVSRVQAKSLDWIADPADTSLDAQVVEALVETLDAHAGVYLSAVDGQSRLSEYRDLLRRTGAALIKNAEERGPFSNPYSEDRLRRKAESSAAYRTAKTLQEKEQQLENEISRIRDAVQEKALKWDEWQNQLVIRIATHFEARYRHWTAEAIERLNCAANTSRVDQADRDVASDSRRNRTTLKVTKWDEIEILFISDERVRIHAARQIENCNYDELGFADRRTGNPANRRCGSSSRVQCSPPRRGAGWQPSSP